MSEEETLQNFEVDSIVFYDGSGHRLGPSECTLTNRRLIIEDAKGGVHQIQIREISGISTPAQIASPKQLRVNLPTTAYDIYCTSKGQRRVLEHCLMKAIGESFS